ncbi:MAG TPA: hypothetical protein VGM14_20625 [Streptosporangiaceae bacterium]
MLRAARELLAVRSPLDAELMVSELLGTWWRQPGQRTGRSRGRRRAEVEEVVGEGLVEYAADQGSPAALALLSGIACLGTSRQAIKAEHAALALMERGVARPAWAEHAGAVEAGDCYVNSDAFCDRDEVICLFSYAGTDEHALVVVVDYNASGMLRDGWVTSRVTTLLERCQELGSPERGPAGNGGADAGFRKVSSPGARKLLESALLVTERAENPPVSDSFPSYHAFVRARIRTLPPTSTKVTALSEPAVLVGRRTTWRSDRRGMLAAEFLASDEAEDLSDLEAASRCTDRIVDYGCDQDFGRPLRVSPAKMETFLLDWLPRKVMLTRSEQQAMPHVLLAWARWAGSKSGLDTAAIGKTLDAVFDSMSAFSKVYRDPSSFGLQPGLVARLLPDRDLEALPRRAFAFGVLDGTFDGTNLGLLDPADHKDRRILMAADHDGRSGKSATGEHLAEHLALTDRLWRGDPPELWEAAQRLLDLGLDRHDVVHALMDAVGTAGPDQNAIRLALANLPPEPLD